MRICKGCKYPWPDDVEECSVCGNREFIAAADAPPPPPKLLPACCPNADCPVLIVSSRGKFCSECASKLTPVTLAAWGEKVVLPAMQRGILKVLFDPSVLLHTGAKMGFLPGEAEEFLDKTFVHLTNATRDQLSRWLSDSVTLLQRERQNILSARQQAIEQATRLGIRTDFARAVGRICE